MVFFVKNVRVFFEVYTFRLQKREDFHNILHFQNQKQAEIHKYEEYST